MRASENLYKHAPLGSGGHPRNPRARVRGCVCAHAVRFSPTPLVRRSGQHCCGRRRAPVYQQHDLDPLEALGMGYFLLTFC